MKLYGNFFSAPSNAARYGLGACKVDFDYHHVNLPEGEHRQPDYLAISKFGKVPALVDEDFHLSESSAIIRYAADKVASPLYPRTSRGRAVVDQWIDYSAHHVRFAMSKVLFNKMFAPMLGVEVDKRSMQDGLNMLDVQLPIVNEVLSQSAFIAGDELSLADIVLISAVDPFNMIDVSLDAYPALKKWQGGMMERDFYKNVHAHYGAELAA